MAKTINNNQANQPTTFYIDATNVCYWRNPEVPSLSVLLKLLLVLKRDKKQSFFCIFDANTAHKLPPEELEIYNFMLGNGNFHQVSGGKRADDYILSLADMYNGCVISNDNYSDPKYSRYKWKDRDSRPTRLFMGEVIKTKDGEHLMLFDLDINVKLEHSAAELFKELEPVLEPVKDYYNGIIKNYNSQKGTGAISFFKETIIGFSKVVAGNQLIEPGQEVKFKIIDSNNILVATELEVVQKIQKGYIVQYDEVKETGFISIDGGPQRLFFRKSYFAEGADTGKITKNSRIECLIGSNSKGECAREVRFATTEEAVAETAVAGVNTDKVKQLEEKLKDLQELLLLANKKITEQAKELKNNQQHISQQTETLQKLHKEELDSLKQRFKAELQALSGAKGQTKQQKEQVLPTIKEEKTQYESKKHANNDYDKKSKPVITPVTVETTDKTAKPAENTHHQNGVKSNAGKQKQEKKGSKEQIKAQPEKQTGKSTIQPTVKTPVGQGKKIKNTPKAEISTVKEELPVTEKTAVLAPAVATENAQAGTKKKLLKKADMEKTVPALETPPNTKTKTAQGKEEKLPEVKTTTTPEAILPGKESIAALPQDFDTADKRLNWWSKLEISWKKAFNVLAGYGESTQKPSDEDLQRIIKLTRIDLSATGSTPLGFKLKNLFGIKNFYHLQYLDVSGHALTNINGTQKLHQLQYFNCSNNKIDSLSGVGNLKGLKVFICAKNKLKAGNFKGISSKLPRLQKLDCRDNGFTEADEKYFAGLNLPELQY
ncbi:hypothetical protein C7N43_25100 [Sphingobacteriales bacterium UPWRP_1]|nr:hypothetical protein BVG80_17215 [Sphingobacteriales bacterium TSM_CSM]PSJ74238.1 hypothetical protein C7N43_25100 [Sphingobacteriales bacterium UPWRP_1]